MSFVKIMAHVIWGTKNRFPFLKKDIRPAILSHIRENAKSKQIYIDSINAVEDHIHILLGLNADLSISKTVQLIKGESSFWINKQKLTSAKFEWSDEYYAVGVCDDNINFVRQYITVQEEPHRKKTFREECEEFLRKYGFKTFQG